MTCFAFSDVAFLLLWSRQKLLEIFLHIEMYKSQPNAAIYIYIISSSSSITIVLNFILKKVMIC